MSDIMIEILEMLEQDYAPRSVAAILNIPLAWVFQAIELETEEA